MLNVPHRTYEREQQKIAAENSESFVKLSAADFEETTFLCSRTDTRFYVLEGRERERENKKIQQREETGEIERDGE